jgi:hypothetical protein
MDSKKHILIYTAESGFLAQRINQNLAEEGIACLLKDKFAVGVNEVILGGRASSVEILVFESDQERAKSIIAEILAE